jgi:hypothetical protein
LGNAGTVFSLSPEIKIFWEGIVMNEPAKSIIEWFSRNWLPLALIVLSIAIFEGFYRKSSKYLGERVRAKVELVQPSMAWQSKNLYLVVRSHETAKLTNCYGVIERMFYRHPSDSHPVEVVHSSPNLSWEGVISENGYISIEGRDRVLNTIKANGDHFSIMYHAPISEDSFSTEVGLDPGKYEMEIAVHGEMDGKLIEPVREVYILELVVKEDNLQDSGSIVRSTPHYAPSMLIQVKA